MDVETETTRTGASFSSGDKWTVKLAGRLKLALPDNKIVVWKGVTDSFPQPGTAAVTSARRLGDDNDQCVLLRVFRPHLDVGRLLANRIQKLPGRFHSIKSPIIRSLLGYRFDDVPNWASKGRATEFRLTRREMLGPLLMSHAGASSSSSWEKMEVYQHVIAPYGKEALIVSIVENCGLTVPDLDAQGTLDTRRKWVILNAAAKFLKSIHNPKTSAPVLVFQDLKPANICCPSIDPIHVKFIDFGAVVPSGTGGTERFATFGFHAPEALNPYLPICPSSDVFAFGCLMYWLISSGPQERDRRPYPMQENGVWDLSTPPSLQDNPILKPLKNLLLLCLDPDPSRRPTDGGSLCSMLTQMDMGSPESFGSE